MTKPIPIDGARQLNLLRSGWYVLLAVLMAGLTTQSWAETEQQPAKKSPAIQVGKLIYAGGMTGACFASTFLDLLARDTHLNLDRQLHLVHLSDEQMLEYPVLIMTGDIDFVLSSEEKTRLANYLNHGGTLLASAGCSDPRWAKSFSKLMQEVFPEQSLKPLTLEHAVFHTLYEIDRLRTKQVVEGPAMFGLELNGRLAVIFSTLGLNASDQAGPGCCCCGGNEIKNASQINANFVVYALTH